MNQKVKQKKPPTQKKQTDKKRNRREIILWLTLVLIVSAWMFGLGVLVGRDTAPVNFDIEKLQKELANLRAALSVKQKASLEKEKKTDSNPKEDLEFFETLKNPNDELGLGFNFSKEKPSIQKNEKTVTKTPPKKPKKNINDKVPVEAIKKKSFKEHPNTNKLTIQIASYKDPKKADQIVIQLKKKGYLAYRSIVKVTGKGVMYRVRVGYFKNRNEANFVLKKLKKDGLNGYVIDR